MLEFPVSGELRELLAYDLRAIVCHQTIGNAVTAELLLEELDHGAGSGVW